jgi:hypothetical protein
MANVRAYFLQPCLLVMLVNGCAHLGWLPPPSIDEQMENLRESATVASPLLTSAAESSPGNPLWVKENSLADISLGMSERALRARYGQPKRISEHLQGTWWLFKGHSPETPSWSLRVHLQGDPTEPAALKVTQVQAWWPSRHQTRTLVRPLDPASRVLRKYGEPEQRVAWGTGEAWVYGAANVAFVVTKDHPQRAAIVAGIVVGL